MAAGVRKRVRLGGKTGGGSELRGGVARRWDAAGRGRRLVRGPRVGGGKG